MIKSKIVGFKINLVLREEDKIYLKDIPESLLEYANDQMLVDAFKRFGIVSKAYIMRKYHVTYESAVSLSEQILGYYKGNSSAGFVVAQAEKAKKRRFH